METLAGGARIRLTGIRLWPHGGSCRPCLEPGAGRDGAQAGAGAALPWGDRCWQEGSALAPGRDRVPHTQYRNEVLPQPTAPPSPGPSPGGMLRDLPRAGPGAVWSRCLPFSPVFPVALTSLFAQPSTRVPASGGGGGHRGHGQGVRMPGGGSPGAPAEAGAAAGRAPGSTRPQAGPRFSAAGGTELRCATLSGMCRSHRRSPAHREGPQPRFPGTGRVPPSPVLPRCSVSPTPPAPHPRRRRRAEAGGGSVGRFYRITALLHQNRAGTGTGRAP